MVLTRGDAMEKQEIWANVHETRYAG